MNPIFQIFGDEWRAIWKFNASTSNKECEWNGMEWERWRTLASESYSTFIYRFSQQSFNFLLCNCCWCYCRNVTLVGESTSWRCVRMKWWHSKTCGNSNKNNIFYQQQQNWQLQAHHKILRRYGALIKGKTIFKRFQNV